MVENITMISLHNLIIGYRGHGINTPLNGCFTNGSMTAIVGVNGSGKSTLLKTIAGLLPPVRGKFIFNLKGRPHISYLSQKSEIDRKFPLTVFDVVAMGCWPDNGLFRKINQTHQVTISNILQRVGLESLTECSISTLSEGQFQRMLFARLLVQKSPIILLDEPFNSIDKTTRNLLITIIKQLYCQGHTIIVVLHDNQLVAQYFPRTLWLSPKQYAWGPSSLILTTYYK